MKLIIQKSALGEALQVVSKAVSNRTAIPILSGIKIDADSSGMTLTASDTDVSIQYFVPAEQEDETVIDLQTPGSIVLPARFFADIVRRLPAEQAEIEVKDFFHTVIRSGSTEIQLNGMDPEEFPSLPVVEEDQVLSLSGDLLKTMIRQTTFAVSTSEMTPILTGVLWNLEAGRLKMVASDRHRLAYTETDLDAADEQSFNNVVIAGKTLNELGKILPDQDTFVDFVVSQNQVLFKLGNIHFYSRILDGTFPDITKAISKSFKTELMLETGVFRDAMERVSLLSREEKADIVKMVIQEDGVVELSSSSSELGKVTEKIGLDRLSGEPLRISFNSRYMLDAVKVFDCPRVRIGFAGPMSPIILMPEEGEQLLQLILPYRTTN